jgi:hypothetical protein
VTENSAIPLRKRTLGIIHAEDGNSLVAVDHVYAPDGAFTCHDCGKPGHDPGMVGLFVDDANDEDDQGIATVMLTAAEALVLANRLQRAAALILESGEDRPDIEREAARFEVPDVVPADPEADPVRKAVWAAWNALDDDDPSPVKSIARDLRMNPADVAAIVFPADQFGHWHDDQEPDLPPAES